MDWIPIRFKELTDEEKTEMGEEFEEFTSMYDCKLPDDGEEVLITTDSGFVTTDTFCVESNGCCYFENYCDFTDVIAWMPFPRPYNTK